MPLGAIFGLWPILKNILYGTGVLKDPADVQAEQQFKLKLLEMAEAKDKAQAQAWGDFIKQTQPVGQVVAGAPAFANVLAALQNFIVAMVRPAITLYLMVHYGPDSMGARLALVFWFGGRSVEKIAGMFVNGNGGTANGASSAAVPTRITGGSNTPDTPESAVDTPVVGTYYRGVRDG